MVDNKKYTLKTKNGETICHSMVMAVDTVDRVRGLMFSEKIPGGDGFLIKPCNSVHTFFMRYPLDLIFLDSNFKVVKVLEKVPPWRMTWMYWRATQTLELVGGHLEKTLKVKPQVGDILEATCIN